MQTAAVATCPRKIFPSLWRINLFCGFHIAASISLILLPIFLNAQSAGDYRSNSATSNWNVTASWQTYNGSSWVDASDYPGQNAEAGAVTILNGHTFTITATVPNAIGALTVGGGTSGSLATDAGGNRTLTITNDLTVAAGASYNLTRTVLTVNGNTSISGSMTDNNSSGSATFTGSFTVNNGGSFSTANNSAFTFKGGITNNGTFNKTGTGAVTFDTNDQEINGSQAIVMNGVVTVTAINLVNNSTDISLTRTVASALTGSGNWEQGANSVLKFHGSSMDCSVDFSTNANTVNYARSGTQTIYQATYSNLTISGSGTKTMDGEITVDGNLAISGTATLACDIYQVTGNASGTFTMGSGTGLSLGNTGDATEVLFPTAFTGGNTTLNSASTVTYQSNDAQTVSVVPAYGNLTINGGGSKTIGGNITIAGNLTVSAGTFDLGTSATTVAISGSAAIAGALSFNGTSTKNVSISGNLSGVGTIDMSGGSLLHSLTLSGASNTIGTLTTAAAGSTITYNASADQQVFGSDYYRNLVISGNSIKTLQGSVTVNNDFTISSPATFNPAGQSLSVNGSTVIAGTFADGTAGGTTSLENVDLSGGTINGTATGVVTVNGNLSVSGSDTIGRVALTVTGTTTVATGRSLTLNSNTGDKTFNGAIIINGTGTWTSTTVTTSARLIFGGGITNNNTSAGSFAAGGATFSTNNQNLAGAGPFTFANAVSISAVIVTNQCSYAGGIVFSSTINGTDAGSTWKNDANTITYYQPAASTQPMNTGTLDVSASGNYFYYSRGNTQNIKSPLTSYYHLSITGGGTGTASLMGNTNVAGNFYLAASNTFNPAGNDFTVAGASLINGTFADGTVAGTSTLQNVDLSGGDIDGTNTGVVNINGTLTMPTGNGTIGRAALTVTGTTTVATGRSLTLDNDNGAKIFIGAITINGTGTWTSTTVTTTANLEVRGGITNNNSSTAFAAGGATFSSNNQNLAGAGAYTFGNAVSISGAITVTNQSSHASGVTFNNTIDGTVASSTWKNDPNTVTYYQPTGLTTQPMNTGGLNVSGSGNYFYYSLADTQNIKTPLTNYYHLYITGGSSAVKTMQGNTACGGNLNVASSTSLNVAAFSLSVTGTTTLDGAISDTSNSGTNTFTGLLDINSGGNLSTASNSPFVFEGGVTNDGTFNKTGTGAVTFNNNQTISGTAAMTMAGTVTVAAGDTVTHSNTSAGGITLSGLLDGANGSSMWRLGANSTVYYQPNATTVPMNTGLLDASGSGSSFYYSRTTGAQTIKTPTSAYHHLIINGGGSNIKTLSGNTTVNGNLTIAATTTLNVDSTQNYSLTLKGNFVNSGTFQARNGTVTFSGTSDQAVTTNASSFYNVVVNNSATQVTLNDNMTVTNLLTLTDGVVTTGSDNRLILTNTASSSLATFGSGSFVNGYLRRHIASNTETYSFPVGYGTGAANYYRADMVNNNLTGSMTYIEARFKPLAGHNDNEMNVSDSWGGGYLSYTTINTAGVWELEPDVPPSGGMYDIKLYIANMTGFTDNNFGPLKRPKDSSSGAAWSTGGGILNNNSSPGRTVASGYMYRKNLTAFSEFGGGGGSGSGQGLPIELVKFTATIAGSEVKIEWTTATETNNDFFTVERSKDAITFEPIGVFDAAGNSAIERLYSTFDKNPLPATSYYRLKQTDIDGSFTYSVIAAVTFDAVENSVSISLTPNPVINRQVTLTVNGSSAEEIASSVFTLYDISGRSVSRHEIQQVSENIPIALPVSVPAGWYLARLKLADTSRVWKIWIE